MEILLHEETLGIRLFRELIETPDDDGDIDVKDGLEVVEIFLWFSVFDNSRSVEASFKVEILGMRNECLFHLPVAAVSFFPDC